MTIGDKIYHLRKNEGLSQEDLANKIDVSRQTISKWEQDFTIPDTVNLIKLCDFFDVKLEYLTNEKNSEVTKRQFNENNFKKHGMELVIFMIGALLFFCTLISAYFMKILEYKMYGSSFDNEINYIFEFPLNVLMLLSLILLIIGSYKIIMRRRGKRKD